MTPHTHRLRSPPFRGVDIVAVWLYWWYGLVSVSGATAEIRGLLRTDCDEYLTNRGAKIVRIAILLNYTSLSLQPDEATCVAVFCWEYDRPKRFAALLYYGT